MLWKMLQRIRYFPSMKSYHSQCINPEFKILLWKTPVSKWIVQMAELFLILILTRGTLIRQHSMTQREGDEWSETLKLFSVSPIMFFLEVHNNVAGKADVRIICDDLKERGSKQPSVYPLPLDWGIRLFFFGWYSSFSTYKKAHVSTTHRRYFFFNWVQH